MNDVLEDREELDKEKDDRMLLSFLQLRVYVAAQGSKDAQLPLQHRLVDTGGLLLGQGAESVHTPRDEGLQGREERGGGQDRENTRDGHHHPDTVTHGQVGIGQALLCMWVCV